MASSKWKTWDEITTISQSKRIVFWGASHWIERTLEKIGEVGDHVVDNNPNNQGIRFAGMPVKAPRTLSDDRSGLFVVITTANYSSVIDELHEMEFAMGDDFCCTPLLMDQRASDALRSLDQQVLITSPQHFSDEATGGGLYALSTADRQVRKLITGKCRGLARAGNNYVLVDMLRGVRIIDEKFKETGLIELPANCEPHGVACDANAQTVFVAQPGRDSVGVYELASGKKIDEIFVSDKWQNNKKDNHHVNDLCVVDNSLYVSLFSFTGNWMDEVYDGGVLEISIPRSELVGPAMSNLWCPHSVSRIDGKLLVLDSMRGQLVTMNWKRLGQFNTFLRGLDHDGQYFYVGMSGFRHADKVDDEAKSIGIDAGLVVFEPDTRLTRTFVVDEFESVHSVLVAKQ